MFVEVARGLGINGIHHTGYRVHPGRPAAWGWRWRIEGR